MARIAMLGLLVAGVNAAQEWKQGLQCYPRGGNWPLTFTSVRVEPDPVVGPNMTVHIEGYYNYSQYNTNLTGGGGDDTYVMWNERGVVAIFQPKTCDILNCPVLQGEHFKATKNISIPQTNQFHGEGNLTLHWMSWTDDKFSEVGLLCGQVSAVLP
eukprot:Hpha_TRINITY_DN12644_c0_g1::TRINITY_DN12644_c0_g1_i1::g.49953::m.49953